MTVLLDMFYLELIATPLPVVNEWYTLQTAAPPGFGTLPNTFVDGFTMTIGPSPIPISYLAGVLLPNTEFPAGTTFRAQIADTTGAAYGSSAALPYALGPPHSAPVTPTSYQPSPPVIGTPLAQLTAGRHVLDQHLPELHDRTFRRRARDTAMR